MNDDSLGEHRRKGRLMRWAFLAELYVSGEPAGKSAESLLGGRREGEEGVEEVVKAKT